MKKMSLLDLDNLKIISVDEVPPTRRYTLWQELFSRIPKGKAAVTDRDLGHNAKCSLHRYHKKGRYLDYYVVNGRDRSYIVHKGETSR